MEIPNSYIIYGTRKYFQNLRVICKQTEQFVIVAVVVVVFLEVHSLLSQKQSVETTLGFFYDNYGNLHYVLRPDTTNGYKELWKKKHDRSCEILDDSRSTLLRVYI